MFAKHLLNNRNFRVGSNSPNTERVRVRKCATIISGACVREGLPWQRILKISLSGPSQFLLSPLHAFLVGRRELYSQQRKRQFCLGIKSNFSFFLVNCDYSQVRNLLMHLKIFLVFEWHSYNPSLTLALEAIRTLHF